MAQVVKCLLSKQEVPSLDSQNAYEIARHVCVCDPSRGQRDRGGEGAKGYQARLGNW